MVWLPGGVERARSRRRARTRPCRLATLGTVSLGSLVGHRARGLLRRWQRVELLDLRRGAREGVSAGARMASPASAIATSCCASRRRSGTSAIRTSRSGCSASTRSRATTARTSRTTTSTSTTRPRTRTCACSTSTRRRRSRTGRLVEENQRAGGQGPEYELLDTGVFDDDRYFDILIEYAKQDHRGSRDPDHRPQPRPRGRTAPHPADAVVSQHVGVGQGPARPSR